MATTIDVVPLHSEEAAPEPRDEKEETNSENNEKAEQLRKRGRPAGAKDNKRRKTPVRRKKVAEAQSIAQEEAPQQSLPSAAPGPSTPQIKEPTVAPATEPVVQPIIPMTASATIPVTAPPTPTVPEMTPFQRSRLQYLQRQSAQQAHWDGIVAPMFRYPIF